MSTKILNLQAKFGANLIIYNYQIFTTMARTKKATAAAAEKEIKVTTIRENLKKLCNDLSDLARKAGREEFTLNQLLRESYNLQEQELDTFEGWKAKGANVRKGQHAYLFWGAPVESKTGHKYCPVAFKFSREQVHFATAQA